MKYSAPLFSEDFSEKRGAFVRTDCMVQRSWFFGHQFLTGEGVLPVAAALCVPDNGDNQRDAEEEHPQPGKQDVEKSR